MPTIHLLIKGKVQGVFYRSSAKEMADILHLHGWVKNTAEGDVEITATGSDSDLQQFTEWCRKGPVHAVVASVTASKLEDKVFEGFRIVRG